VDHIYKGQKLEDPFGKRVIITYLPKNGRYFPFGGRALLENRRPWAFLGESSSGFSMCHPNTLVNFFASL
jgi:hypothetical protein